MNPTNTKKKPAAKKAPAKKKNPAAAKKATTTTPKKKRRRVRRRNPGLNVGSLLLGTVGGAVGELLATPSAKLAGGMIKSPAGSRLAGAGAGFVVPVAAGLALGHLHPMIGIGAAAAGGAAAARQVLGAAAIGTEKGKGIALLRRAGWGQLSAPDNVFIRDGQVWRRGEGGAADVMLFGLEGERVTLELEDGRAESVTLLGELPEGAVVMDAAGQMRLVEAPIEQVNDHDRGALHAGDPELDGTAITVADPELDGYDSED